MTRTLLALMLLLAPAAVAATPHPEEGRGLKSLNSDEATTVRFDNGSGRTVQLYWIDYDGARQHYATLAAGQWFLAETFVTHPWLVTDADGNAVWVVRPIDRPSTFAITPPPPRPAAAENRVLHALLIGDTDDRAIGAACAADLAAMASLLEGRIPASRRRVYQLSGRRVTAGWIAAMIRAIPAGPDDAMLVYFSGHGGVTRDDFILSSSSGRLSRNDLNGWLGAKDARLKVLMTDCCSTYVPTARAGGVAGADGEEADGGDDEPAARRDPFHPGLRGLFFRNAGAVNVTAAEIGTSAFCYGEHGGVFTVAFRDVLGRLEGRIPPGKVARCNWEGVLRATANATEARFRDVAAEHASITQRTQRPIWAQETAAIK